jgi:hypothetical protein
MHRLIQWCKPHCGSMKAFTHPTFVSHFVCSTAPELRMALKYSVGSVRKVNHTSRYHMKVKELFDFKAVRFISMVLALWMQRNLGQQDLPSLSPK